MFVKQKTLAVKANSTWLPGSMARGILSHVTADSHDKYRGEESHL
jgi:hypothetical protein